MDRIKLKGIVSFISFLQLLDRQHVRYHLGRSRDDCVMVTIYMVGRRIELEFFQDRVEYGWFDGDESCHDDQGWLYDVLDEWVRE